MSCPHDSQIRPQKRLLTTVFANGILEDFAQRWEVPFAPEFEMSLFRRLFAAELRLALKAHAGAKTAKELALRGRVRRLLGDPEAATDLRAALDLNPDLAQAHAWLGEAGLGEPGSLDSLDRAVEIDPKDGWARTYRGAGRLLEKDAKGAASDLAAAARLLPKEALPVLLLGLALSRLKKKAPADAALRRALKLEPSLKVRRKMQPIAAPRYLIGTTEIDRTLRRSSAPLTCCSPGSAWASAMNTVSPVSMADLISG